MAAPTPTPSTGDIWHLTIDDLLAPLPETVRLGGAGPFVINLSSSSAPIVPSAKSIASCAQAHLYQVQRIEDGRMRHRLRLGPFSSEDDADAALKKVRDDFPSALTATADADDLRAIAALRPKPAATAAMPVAVPVLTAVQKIPVREPAPVAPVAPVRAAAAAMPVLGAPAMAAPAASPPARSVAAAVVPTSNSAPTTPPTPIRAATAPREPAAAVPAPRAPAARGPEQPATRAPSLESTQTVRALTQLELEDDQASRWFAIQLALSEEAFDPETVPNLDIFTVYRLYSVAGIDQGRIVHALRLGFFTEQIAAGAVASYLAAFYEKPAIKRVSTAERERFAEQSLEPRKDVGATGKQAVIEITNERYIRERRMGQAAK